MTPEQHSLLLAHTARLFAPRPQQSVSAWCEDNLIFDEPENRGPFTLAGRDYMREPLDSWADPEVTDVVIVSGSQIGKTATIMGGAAWLVANNPTRLFWVMPTRDTVLKFSRTRWQKLLQRCDCFRDLLPEGARRHDFSTFTQVVGGSIIDMVWSNSPAALAGIPARVVILDEVDKFARGTGKEADAVDLAEQRTKDFSNALRIKTSTPTLVEGLIWQDLLKTDFRRWFVPCPLCRKRITLAWSEGMTSLPKDGREAYAFWDPGAKLSDGTWDLERVRASAHYRCPHCSGKILDAHRTGMNRDGAYEATRTSATGQRGYHLPSLYSPSSQANVGALAVKFLQAKHGLLGLQGFINGNLAEPYIGQDRRGQRKELVADRIEVSGDGAWHSLMTVDVQQTAPHFWYVVRRWMAGNSEAVAAGSVDSWEQLRLVQKEHDIQDTGVAVDSGADTLEVYRRCWAYGRGHGKVRLCWMPTKGRSGRQLWRDPETKLMVPYLQSAQDPFRDTPQAGTESIDVWTFSVDLYKDMLSTLRSRVGAGYKWSVRPNVATEEYWHHMDAEEKVIRQRVATWRKISERWPNHLLDCEVMQLFVASFLGLFAVDFAGS